jgi:hypothetical protein
VREHRTWKSRIHNKNYPEEEMVSHGICGQAMTEVTRSPVDDATLPINVVLSPGASCEETQTGVASRVEEELGAGA